MGTRVQDDILRIWTVYEKPTDYPQGFVVRQFFITPTGAQSSHAALYADTLGDIETYMAMNYPGLIWMPRDPKDEPQIVGTWL